MYIRNSVVSFPDRFFPFLVVVITTNKNGKKQPGNETRNLGHVTGINIIIILNFALL